jgi:hypothetical protein
MVEAIVGAEPERVVLVAVDGLDEVAREAVLVERLVFVGREARAIVAAEAALGREPQETPETEELTRPSLMERVVKAALSSPRDDSAPSLATKGGKKAMHEARMQKTKEPCGLFRTKNLHREYLVLVYSLVYI